MIGNCYLFARATEDELTEWHAEAARLAAILGAGPVAPADAVGVASSWRIANPAALEFGQEVHSDIVSNPASGVVRGSIGLARCGQPVRWLHIERVPVDEVTAWEEEKHSGAGRDRRLGARKPDGGRSVISLQEALAAFRPLDLTKVKDWPHAGPRALLEVVKAILALGLTMLTYHDHWAKESGIHRESSVC